MNHLAVCSHSTQRDAALILATTLRRMGEAVDYMLSGKPDKQFKRAQRDGASQILMIRQDGSCRLWWPVGPAVETTLADATHYLMWVADDTDQIPDPPEYMILTAESFTP